MNRQPYSYLSISFLGAIHTFKLSNASRHSLYSLSLSRICLYS
jgi:hypothetical protein